MTMPSPMNHAALREEVCRVGRVLYRSRLAHATAGNISVRLPDGAGFLITPTDACLGTLEPQRLAEVATDGTQRSGDRASKTLVLHRRIYDAAPDAHCVIHTHSTHLVALTLAKRCDGGAGGDTRDVPGGVAGGGPCQGIWQPDAILPPITPYFVMKVGRVPLIDYHRPGDPAVGDLVAQAIAQASAAGRPLRAVMLDRLGPNVWHDSPANALATLEELEETARLWLMSRPRPSPLTDAQIDELRQAFGAQW